MRPLSAVETRMLTTVRLFADIVTLGSDPAGAQSRLLGSTICFPIDTVKRVSHHFDVNGCAVTSLLSLMACERHLEKGVTRQHYEREKVVHLYLEHFE